MTTTTNPPCSICGNGTHRLPWGTEVPDTERAVIELEGIRYPVHRACITSFVARPDDDAEAWESQRATALGTIPVDARARDVERARALRGAGRSLFEIAVETGRSKEWLRAHAGLR